MEFYNTIGKNGEIKREIGISKTSEIKKSIDFLKNPSISPLLYGKIYQIFKSIKVEYEKIPNEIKVKIDIYGGKYYDKSEYILKVNISAGNINYGVYNGDIKRENLPPIISLSNEGKIEEYITIDIKNHSSPNLYIYFIYYRNESGTLFSTRIIHIPSIEITPYDGIYLFLDTPPEIPKLPAIKLIPLIYLTWEQFYSLFFDYFYLGLRNVCFQNIRIIDEDDDRNNFAKIDKDYCLSNARKDYNNLFTGDFSSIIDIFDRKSSTTDEGYEEMLNNIMNNDETINNVRISDILFTDLVWDIYIKSFLDNYTLEYNRNNKSISHKFVVFDKDVYEIKILHSGIIELYKHGTSNNVILIGSGSSLIGLKDINGNPVDIKGIIQNKSYSDQDISIIPESNAVELIVTIKGTSKFNYGTPKTNYENIDKLTNIYTIKIYRNRLEINSLCLTINGLDKLHTDIYPWVYYSVKDFKKILKGDEGLEDLVLGQIKLTDKFEDIAEKFSDPKYEDIAKEFTDPKYEDKIISGIAMQKTSKYTIRDLIKIIIYNTSTLQNDNDSYSIINNRMLNKGTETEYEILGSNIRSLLNPNRFKIPIGIHRLSSADRIRYKSRIPTTRQIKENYDKEARRLREQWMQAQEKALNKDQEKAPNKSQEEARKEAEIKNLRAKELELEKIRRSAIIGKLKSLKSIDGRGSSSMCILLIIISILVVIVIIVIYFVVNRSYNYFNNNITT